MRSLLLITFVLLMTKPLAALEIAKDTEWSGELSFAEDVRVMPGATLTIAPGANLHFVNARLEVAGRLVASGVTFWGEKWDGVVLKGTDASTRLSDSLIKGAKTGLLVQGGTPELSGLTLAENKVGLELRGKAGGKVIGSNFINNEKVGLFVKDDSTTAVANCRFEKNGRFGSYLYRAKPQTFRDNSFVDNAVALMVAYYGSDPVVANNRFERNDIALQVDRSARPVVQDNLLIANRIGVYAYRRSDPRLVGNLIANNNIGVLVAYSSYPQIEGNDFIDNQLALKLEYQSSLWEQQRGANARASETATRTAFAGQGMRTVNEADRQADRLDGTVSARGNWWGKSGSSELDKVGALGNPSFIHDGRDQSTFIDAGEEYPLDKVTYSPWSPTPLTGRAP